MQPDIRYAPVEGGETHVAYCVLGTGPDLVLPPPLLSHLGLLWENPRWVKFSERLATFSRLITYDKRGTGMSDPMPGTGAPTLEERVDEIAAVMNAAGSERATLFGYGEGGSAVALFAATYPERTERLILCNTIARTTPAPDHPWGMIAPILLEPEEELKVGPGWLGDPTLGHPSTIGDEAQLAWVTRLELMGASPSMARALRRNLRDLDVRAALTAIQSPTLVMHRRENNIVPAEGARYIADRIPGARFVELPGGDQWIWIGDVDPLLDEVEEFVTGVRPAPLTDRVLATVLFTDIVASTQRAEELGDRHWRELLAEHNDAVRRELSRFRGREVNTLGDGFVATFDGPARAIHCAWAVGDGVRRLGIRLRAGAHTGECELVGADLSGIAVHIAARICDAAAPGEVLVSSTVKELVSGSGIRFGDRGAHALKGVADEWRLYAAER